MIFESNDGQQTATADRYRINPSPLEGRTILITGGTGSLGTALAERLMHEHPMKIILFSSTEHKQRESRRRFGDNPVLRWRMGNVRDFYRLYQALQDVEIIIHAAAMKDIDECRRHPQECHKTNVLGTENVINAAIDRGIKKLLLISTDKAVNPTTTYGTSKAFAEALVLDAENHTGGQDIAFSVCRYGNVIGSAGSVIPYWADMIKKGADKLPITDRRMTRFFWSMAEAVEFVIASAKNMQGGEVFVPKLKAARMIDVAEAFGLPWYETGIRESEKLHEELEPGFSSETAEKMTVSEIRQLIKEWL